MDRIPTSSFIDSTRRRCALRGELLLLGFLRLRRTSIASEAAGGTRAEEVLLRTMYRHYSNRVQEGLSHLKVPVDDYGGSIRPELVQTN
jgi:hypothetical protein